MLKNMHLFPYLACFALVATVRLSAEPVLPIIFQASYEDTLDATGARGPVKPLEVSGKVEYRPGKVGKALLCGGDAASIKYPVEGNVRATQGTVEMWVQPVDWPADEQCFHVFFETQGPGWLVLYKFWNGGLLMLSGIDHEHYGSAWWEAGAMKASEWHHLVGTWGKQRLAFYVDGVLRKSTAVPALPQGLAGWFRIGDDGWGKPHTSHTLVDEVKVYRYALPADQVALAAQGRPVTYAPPLPISVEPHPARGSWSVLVDAAGYVAPDGPGRSARVEVLTGDKPSATGRIDSFTDGAATTVIDISKVSVGQHTVRATVLDAAGKAVTRNETSFTKPAAPPWPGNDLGMQARVLPPFTEIRVGGIRAIEARAPMGKTVECWGRKYTMDSLFPTQIESAGQPMLAGPVRLSLESGGQEIPVQRVTSRMGGWSPTRARCSASGQAGKIAFQTDTSIEYDGMLWTDLTLTPQQEVELSGLSLHIPVHAANAKYIHHLKPSWVEDTAGLLPEKGWEAPAFQPYLWVGDDDRGLAWFAESEKGWSLAPGKPAESVSPSPLAERGPGGEVVDMVIHFINQPTTLTKPLHLAFGLQATPVKPRPANARSWRLGNLGAAGYMDMPSMGTLQVIWPNGNLAAYGYPWPKDPAEFRKRVADLHAKHVRVIPYVNLNFCAADAPEWQYYSSDWLDSARSFTSGDVAEMGPGTYGACPHTAAWRDFIAYKLAKFVDEFGVDGIYVDCWNPNACLVEEHGCGWRDAAGNLHGTFQLRDYREIVRRVREILADRRPDPHIIIHMSTSVCIPMLAFADSMLDGEQYQATTQDPKDDYLGIVPLDKWRAENTGLQWGVVPFFLPEFSGPNQKLTVPTDRLMGIMLAHDCSPWPIWCNSQVIFDTWKACDRFGIVDAQFRPYWKPNGVTTDNPDVIVSAYSKPGKALLVVLNAGKTDTSVNVKVDGAALGLKAGLGAAMATDDTPVPVANGALRLEIPARGYKMVVVK